MKMYYLLAAVLVGFVCVGCGQDDNGKSAVEKSEPAVQVQEQVQESTQEQMFTQEAMDKINQVAGPMQEKVEKATGEVAVKVAVKTGEARQRTEEFAAALKEESVPVMKKTGSALIIAGEKVQQAAEVLSAPETVVIDNKNGKVTLPHRQHGKSLGCQTCHADKAPGAMALGKDKAHALCKGCHKEQGKGPTACTGCHEKKKPVAAAEGC